MTQRYLIRSDGVTNGKIAAFLRIAHARVPAPTVSNGLHRHAVQRLSPGARGQPHTCRQPSIPIDVQAFLRTYSQDLLRKDLKALMAHFTDRFLNNGYTKQDAYAFLYRGIQRQTFHRHEITLTRFDRHGDVAEIDGYVQRKGYRIPLMITAIIKDADARWRWYGNQKPHI